jgi:hypothetical protein
MPGDSFIETGQRTFFNYLMPGRRQFGWPFWQGLREQGDSEYPKIKAPPRTGPDSSLEDFSLAETASFCLPCQFGMRSRVSLAVRNREMDPHSPDDILITATSAAIHI